VSKGERDMAVWRSRELAKMQREKRGGIFWDRVRALGMTIHQGPVGFSRARKNRTRYLPRCAYLLAAAAAN
jgi:hypothetical protein